MGIYLLGVRKRDATGVEKINLNRSPEQQISLSYCMSFVTSTCDKFKTMKQCGRKCPSGSG